MTILIGTPCPVHSNYVTFRMAADDGKYWCRRKASVTGPYDTREYEHDIPPGWAPFEIVTFDPTMIEESPWNRTDWSGEFVAINDRGQPADLGDGRGRAGAVRRADGRERRPPGRQARHGDAQEGAGYEGQSLGPSRGVM